MIYTGKTKKAIKLMFDKQKNEIDKGGMPYVFHPFHLAEQMETEDEVVVALLHDIVEDTDVNIEKLAKMGFTKKEIDAISIMTHNKNDSYEEYIKKISTNKIATKVKIADLKHNLDITRLNEIKTKDLEKIEKYKKSLNYLENIK